jgi:hypothetical protein
MSPQAVSSNVVSKYIGDLCFRMKDTEAESHSTEMIRFHEFERAFTMKIKTTQGLHDADRGSRANILPLYITVSRKLLPITTLTGDQFLAAWWQIVTSGCSYRLVLFIVYSLLLQVIVPSGRRACVTAPSAPAIVWGTTYVVDLLPFLLPSTCHQLNKMVLVASSA